MGTLSIGHILVLSVIFLPILAIILHLRQPKVVLQHPDSHKVKVIPLVYSWSGSVFGPIVPLLRGDIAWFFIYLIIGGITYGLGNIVLSFFYNKKSISALIADGYIPLDDSTKQLLISKNIIVAEQE